ncbi:D-xylulose 5-phosphate/D-fructose 6-phosphate phosphoketolase-domain-containing protein [Mycena belliarum]|uniref:D-xylulose 5-phosphate/D-fructose 6-phosphate phosphoketolase-domain-containing protein n=1 Tax=Mycena belliarum TaxID=1033014 RepID=A0AAD6TVG8_9AGAR|nr:D-xylulose 5-phosphate/D-fructose 6-phosphate phosphoketolase-domain-containing protein [Mycena belliae]
MPKGLGGPKSFHGELIEGSFHSHQVPLPGTKTSRPEELFTAEGVPVAEILGLVPQAAEKRLGQKWESFRAYAPLAVPEWTSFCVEQGTQESCMKAVGRLLKGVVKDPKGFHIFSPGGLVSDKLDAVLDDSWRNFQRDIEWRARGGREIEILSEHTCQGMLQGYTLTGRTGLFPSYEAFLGIVQTMMVQYSKFTKMAAENPWREPCGSLNYFETSTWARQEHNCFSHQNPAFISAVLNRKAMLVRVYLPPDARSFLSAMSHYLRANNYVNLMVGSKQPTPVSLSLEDADKHCNAGASVWKFESVDDGVKSDVVLVGIGVEVTFEIAVAALLRKHVPELRVRVVNVTDLMILSTSGTQLHALSVEVTVHAVYFVWFEWYQPKK